MNDARRTTWTLDSAFIHLRDKIETVEKLLMVHRDQDDQRHQSEQDAIAKSEKAMEHRLETLNDVRAGMVEIAKSAITRPEYDSRHEAMSERIQALERRIEAVVAEKAGQRAMMVGLVALASIAGFLMIWIPRLVKP